MTHAPNESSDALRTSWIIQSEASSLGFDWPDVSGVLEKVREETGEIEEALERGDREQARRELGDLFFAAVNLARFLDADPSEELDRANMRFTCRFEMLKSELRREGRNMKTCSLAQLDEVWERVKKGLK